VTASASSQGMRMGYTPPVQYEGLTPEEEQALFQKVAKGDAAAREELILRHRPLVGGVAAKEARRSKVDYQELFQEGFVGLLIALERFEADRGVRFSTYSRWWIFYYVRRFVTRNRRIVVPATHRAGKLLSARLYGVRHQLEQTHGREVTVTELAEALEVDVQEVLATLVLWGKGDVQLQGDPVDGEKTLELPSSTPTPEELAIENERQRQVHEVVPQLVSQLDPREQRIVLSRVLAEDGTVVPHRQLGALLGVSHERVRQLEERALGKMDFELARLQREKKLDVTV